MSNKNIVKGVIACWFANEIGSITFSVRGDNDLLFITLYNVVVLLNIILVIWSLVRLWKAPYNQLISFSKQMTPPEVALAKRLTEEWLEKHPTSKAREQRCILESQEEIIEEKLEKSYGNGREAKASSKRDFQVGLFGLLSLILVPLAFISIHLRQKYGPVESVFAKIGHFAAWISLACYSLYSLFRLLARLGYMDF